MNESILQTIKKLLGIDPSIDVFDQDIMIHINTVFMILTQLGVGPKDGFAVHGPEDVWSAFLEDPVKIEQIKTYIYLRVRLLFDPPSTSFVIDAITKNYQEIEWRLNFQEPSG